jgi:hypothetical protein
MKFMERFAAWLLEPAKRNRSQRYSQPGLVAYYWDGGVPCSHEIADLSLTGLYMFTTERWHRGTIVEVTLRRENDQNASAEFVIISCQVIWHGPSGVAFKFLSPNDQQRHTLMRFVADANRSNVEFRTSCRRETVGESKTETGHYRGKRG